MPSYDDESSSEEIKVSSAPKRKPLPRVSKRKHKEILLMDDSVESDFDPNEDDEGSPHRREKRKTPSTKTPGKKEGNYVCPHCQKTFSSEGGLKYHTSKFVCRLEQSTDPQVKARGTKRRRGKGKKGDTPDKRRFRGSLENRTCPHCNRVFTSALGMNYHISRKVCQQVEVHSGKVFQTLQSGEKYVTSFGIVEVVKDDRATPTATIVNDKEKLKVYQASKSKVNQQKSKAFCDEVIHLRARRIMLNKVYEEGKINRASVFHAYFGGNPKPKVELEPSFEAKSQSPHDPLAPPDSFPDRMIECISIPDTRKRYLGDEKIEVSAATPPFPPGSSSHRIFLQRRLLTEAYIEGSKLYVCADCGRHFNSLPGYQYHANCKVCTKKSANIREARRKRGEQVEEAAKHVLKLKPAPRAPLKSFSIDSDDESAAGESSRLARFRTRSRTSVPVRLQGSPKLVSSKDRTYPSRKKKRVRKKKVTSMYPEVLVSLGYKVVKENMEFTKEMLGLPEVIDSKVEVEVEIQNDLTRDPPDALLEHLKHKLVESQRLSDDQKYGSMYAEVYKSLKYKKAPKHKLGKKQNNIGSKKRRRRSLVIKPPPPIIDVSALADEIDSGRYPSKSRYNGEHADKCIICKDGGLLLCCDFCPNVVHMNCILEKFTLKAPEPDEDFMCHKCIQMVLARRKRAEGRRIKKQEKEEIQKEVEEKQNSGVKRGMEYEHLASKGQDFSELVELLQDARQRLRQSLATRKMNDLRRKIIGYDDMKE